MIKDYVHINRDVWDGEAEEYARIGARLWAMPEPVWGCRGIVTRIPLLPEDMSGQTAIELGCGTGYVSSWMSRRGARVTAIDLTPAQLATARRLAEEHGAEITFVEGNAEATGLPEAGFDFAISEYGASIWCRPERWLREAWRLLKPGGRLVFLGNHPLSLICSPLDGAPCERVLHRPYREMWGADWTEVALDPSGICFNLTVSDWFRLFHEVGFAVENYEEIYAPDDATGTIASVPAEWARDFPHEQVWHLRKPV